MTVATLDARPDEVELYGYAGDTLTVHVVAPVELVAGREWTGQVRDTRDGTAVAATFTILPPAGDGRASVTLSAADTRALADRGAPVRVNRTTTVVRYRGVWDVQIAAPGGGDPVTTLVHGPITIDLDVTRATP